MRAALGFLLVFLVSSVEAQIHPGLHLWATSDQVLPGEVGTVRILGDTAAGSSEVTGWSFGVCHDGAVVQVDGVFDGITTATVNEGLPPDLQLIEVLPGGWTASVVISATGTATLPALRTHELYSVEYLATGAANQTTSLDFCDTLGTPPVPTRFETAAGPVAPGTTPGQLEILNRYFEFFAPLCTFHYVPGSPPFEVTGTMQVLDLTSYPLESHGLALAQGYAPDVVEAVAVEPAGPLAGMNEGAGPDFFWTEFGPGYWTLGIIFNFIGTETLPYPEVTDVVAVSFETAFGQDAFGAQTELYWSNEFGSPPVTNVVVGSGQSFVPLFDDGLLRFVPYSPQDLIRGDCDQSGTIQIGDPIEVLQILFQALPSDCPEACDASGDGQLDLADAIYLLQYGFQGGPPPAPPFPDCGEVPPALGCLEYAACP